MEYYSHEYSLQFSKGHVKKIDMVVRINGKNPIMVIECKKANANLRAKTSLSWDKSAKIIANLLFK